MNHRLESLEGNIVKIGKVAECASQFIVKREAAVGATDIGDQTAIVCDRIH